MILHEAISKRSLKLVRSILKEDPTASNQKTKDEYEWSALMSAAEFSHNLKIVEAIIKAGANLNYQAPQCGTSALMSAIYSSHFDAAKEIIAAGADPNLYNHNGKTALHFAADKKNAELVKHLIISGADIYAKDKYGQTAFDIAKCNPHTETLATFVEKDLINNWCILMDAGVNMAWFEQQLTLATKLFKQRNNLINLGVESIRSISYKYICECPLNCNYVWEVLYSHHLQNPHILLSKEG